MQAVIRGGGGGGGGGGGKGQRVSGCGVMIPEWVPISHFPLRGLKH